MFAIFFVGFAIAAVILSVLLRSGMAWRIATDVPNFRSLHTRPIPRVGGWGVIPAAVVAAFLFDAAGLLLVALVALLFAISYFDDRFGMPIYVRLPMHTGIAIIWVVLGPASLPLALAGAAIFAIMWWSNLYNFMDGANGLAGGMGVIGFLAYAIAAAMSGMEPLALWSLAISGACAGFLLFNFHAPKIFLGDAGSVSLGFFVGALGLWGWSGDAWPAWFPLLVFAPFFLDATITLMARMLRGERFWSAHLEHYYQRLIRMGWSHRKTALHEYALMAISSGFAVAMLNWDAPVQYTGLAIAMLIYVGIALLIDRRWIAFLALEGKRMPVTPRLSTRLMFASLLPAPVLYVVTLLPDPPSYPYVIAEIPHELRATFLHDARPKKAQCEADLAKMVRTIQAKCPTCKITEYRCLDKLEPAQSLMFTAAPIDLPSVRLPDGTVTFESEIPNFAISACKESERQASTSLNGKRVECSTPGKVRKTL